MVEDALRGRTDYTHDARGRLVAQTHPNGTLHRTMDAVGNLYRTLTQTERHSSRGSLLENVEGCRYTYDADGNQTEKVEADGRRWCYRWNGAGLLVEVVRPDGSNVHFEYDAFARRTRKVLDCSASNGSPAVESRHLFHLGQPYPATRSVFRSHRYLVLAAEHLHSCGEGGDWP